jgi:hypothetical protein
MTSKRKYHGMHKHPSGETRKHGEPYEIVNNLQGDGDGQVQESLTKKLRENDLRKRDS